MSRRARQPMPLFETAAGAPTELANGMLDLWEAQTRLLLEVGCEAALRARIERLLSGHQPMNGRVGACAGAASKRPDAAVFRSAPDDRIASPDRMALAGALGTLSEIDRRYRLRETEAMNVAQARRVLLGLLRHGSPDEQRRYGLPQKESEAA